MKSEKLDAVSVYSLLAAGLCMLASLITDTILVFSKLQNYDSGEFMITALQYVDWPLFGIVTAIGAVLSLGFVFFVAYRAKKR